jgi:malate dehydrogenase
MSISVAILGASGAVGGMLATQILRSDLLEPGDRLQLVGHGASSSEEKLLGTRIDLLDAFDEERVEIEMVPNIGDVDADIVVVTAGATLSPEVKTRRDLGAQNRPIFEHIAEECANSLPDALFIVVSNPVELGVEILAARVDCKRVMGMGAEQDSLRFARAIARDLGISRRYVRASVLGEHGQAMVPVWSAVELLLANPSLHDSLHDLRERAGDAPLQERVARLQAEVVHLLEAHQIPEAYEVARRALPDARIFVEPFITLQCMHSTPNATANATLHCLEAVLANDSRRIHGQVLLEGEVLGMHGVCGVPIALSRTGWQSEGVDGLAASEREMLVQSAKSIREFTSGILCRGAEA